MYVPLLALSLRKIKSNISSSNRLICENAVAEKTFLSMRTSAEKHPNIRFLAVSHSTSDATNTWLDSLGGHGAIEIVVDEDRDLFAQWGLGVSSFWHVLSPWALWSVYRLGNDEGIWNRPTESGNRWQTAGSFACDGQGVVRWGKAAGSASETPDFEEAVSAVKGTGEDEGKGKDGSKRDSAMG